MNAFVTIAAVLGILGGCASREVMNSDDLEPGPLPAPNVTLNIPGLGPSGP